MWKQVFAGALICASMASAYAELLIGQTAGFTGPVAAGVAETHQGAKLYIDAVNAKGGVNGQKIQLISLDDNFDPKKSGENARILIEERKVLSMFLTRGTPHTQSVLPYLEKNRTPLVGPSTGAMVLHEPVNRWVFNVRAPYQRESKKAVIFLHTIGLTRIGVVHAADSFGADAAEGARKGFDEVKLKPVVVISADRSKPDFDAIIPQLLEAKVQAVVWAGSGTAVSNGIKALRKAGSSAQIVTLSNNASSGFIDSLGETRHGVIVSQVYPSERAVAFKMVSEAQALAKGAGVGTISPAMLEGFAAAKVLVEGLRRAGANPTRETLAKALETMSPYDLGGLSVDYSADDHTGLDFAELSIIGSLGKFRR